MRLSWSIGWPGVMDAVGGNPVLVRDGELHAQECSGYVCRRHPRTGVGITARGRVLLVTVDGRQADSYGMTITSFARLFKQLGAVHALNLDGGGSSTMVVEGSVINSPSDMSGEREVASALLVLRGPDPDEADPVSR